MSDAEKIQRLERELQQAKAQIADLSTAVRNLTRSSELRKKSVQSALDDIHGSVKLIFKHVHVPNVTFNPNVHHVID